MSDREAIERELAEGLGVWAFGTVKVPNGLRWLWDALLSREIALREAREELVKENEDSNRRVDGIATDYEREYEENKKLREKLEQVRELLRRATRYLWESHIPGTTMLANEIEAVLSPAPAQPECAKCGNVQESYIHDVTSGKGAWNEPHTFEPPAPAQAEKK